MPMNVALIDTSPRKWKRDTPYPLGLLRIGAWREAQGDTCRLFLGTLPDGQFDVAYCSTLFTFNSLHAAGLIERVGKQAKRVVIGGISSTLMPQIFKGLGEIHAGLLAEAEAFQPDYSLLPWQPTYSIAHTSRGCIRRCGFCAVSKVEPEFYDRPQWRDDLLPDVKTVQFYDNNWFAKPKELWLRDVGWLHELVAAGRVKTIDFNQGLDARILTEDMADALRGLPISPMRFAFDGMQEDGHYQRAVRMMAARGFRSFMAYVLFNYTDTPEDFYYRLRVSAELHAELGCSVASFPMRYRPVMSANPENDYVGKHWAGQMIQAFMALVATSTTFGQVSPCDMAEFERYFGKTPQEFLDRLCYSNIRRWCKRLKSAGRHTGRKAVLDNA